MKNKHSSKKKKEITEALQVSPQYNNAEKSWLAFNERVCACAQKKVYPLFERLRFLSIAANNLDEFFMVYFGRLYNRVHQKHSEDPFLTTSEERLYENELLNELRLLAIEQMRNHVRLWGKLRKELRSSGIDVMSPKDLTNQDLEWLEKYFLTNIFPVLTPMALDASHPVPLIQSQEMSIVVQLQRGADTIPVYAFIPLPAQLPRFVEIPFFHSHQPINNDLGDDHPHSYQKETANHQNPRRYIALEHVLAHFLGYLFSNYNVLAQGLFRIVRNSQMEFLDNVTSNLDLRDEFEEALGQRLHGEIVFLAVNARMPENLRLFVSEQFDVAPLEVIVIDGFLGINNISELIEHHLPHHNHLSFPKFQGRVPQRIRHNNYDIFESITIKDILIHHPYESFEVIIMFLKMAARDKNVVAIKLTLYRTGSNSQIVEALIEAAKNGISVTVLVEIKARFDEEANIKWTKDLEAAGAHVIYGIAGLKTHAKLCLVMRKEGNSLKTYAHFSTGNYNAKTAALYEDLSLLTADEFLCRDAAKIFHYITGYARTDNLEKIIVSPSALRKKLQELIEIEINNAKSGQKAHIWLKMNALTDIDMINLLYRASQAGVKIDLIVRSMCCLVPGVEGLSQNIRVKSILGRFLEHARIFCFGNGHSLPSSHAKVFISSADWMPRNLDSRFEIMVPMENLTVHKQILEEIMLCNLNDTAGSWELKNHGLYDSLQKNESDFSAQDYFIKHISLSGSGMGPYPVTPHVVQPNEFDLR